MEQLIQELKESLIEALNLEDITPEEIENDAPLFGDSGLGLELYWRIGNHINTRTELRNPACQSGWRETNILLDPDFAEYSRQTGNNEASS